MTGEAWGQKPAGPKGVSESEHGNGSDKNRRVAPIKTEEGSCERVYIRRHAAVGQTSGSHSENMNVGFEPPTMIHKYMVSFLRY